MRERLLVCSPHANPYAHPRATDADLRAAGWVPASEARAAVERALRLGVDMEAAAAGFPGDYKALKVEAEALVASFGPEACRDAEGGAGDA